MTQRLCEPDIYSEVCHNIATKESSPVAQEVCQEMPREQGSEVNDRRSETVEREECQNLPRLECNEVSERQCKSFPRQECDDESRRHSSLVPRIQTKEISERKCFTVTSRKCDQVPKQVRFFLIVDCYNLYVHFFTMCFCRCALMPSLPARSVTRCPTRGRCLLL